MINNTSRNAIFKIASLVSVMGFSGLGAIEFSDYHKQLALGKPELIAGFAATQGFKATDCHNDLDGLLGLSDGVTPEESKRIAKEVVVSFNGYKVEPGETRKIPIKNGIYTLSLHNDSKFMESLTSCLAKSSNTIKAAALNLISKVTDLCKWRLNCQCKHDGSDTQYVSNIIISQGTIRNLIDLPGGLYNTLKEFARQVKISLRDWRIQFDLHDNNHQSDDSSQEVA